MAIAMEKNGMCLEFVSETLKNNSKLVVIACSQNGQAL